MSFHPSLCPALPSSVSLRPPPQCSIPIGHYLVWILASISVRLACHPLLIWATWLCCVPRVRGGAFSHGAITAPPKNSQEVHHESTQCACQSTGPLNVHPARSPSAQEPPQASQLWLGAATFPIVWQILVPDTLADLVIKSGSEKKKIRI